MEVGAGVGVEAGVGVAIIAAGTGIEVLDKIGIITVGEMAFVVMAVSEFGSVCELQWAVNGTIVEMFNTEQIVRNTKLCKILSRAQRYCTVAQNSFHIYQVFIHQSQYSCLDSIAYVV